MAYLAASCQGRRRREAVQAISAQAEAQIAPPGRVSDRVDNEVGRFHGDGPRSRSGHPRGSSLILSFLLWWIQPAGPMIAG